MNSLRILVIAALGLTTTHCYAVPVRFTLEGEPFTEWEFALRDSAGMITSINVADADADGRHTFVTEYAGISLGVHISSGPSECIYLVLGDSIPSARFPFLMSGAGDRLVVEVLGTSADMFSIGQPVTVSNGTIAGLDGLVHENPGITTAVDLLAIDVSALPTFTGAAEVRGLMTVEVIPEPSTGALILLAMTSIGAIACRKRF